MLRLRDAVRGADESPARPAFDRDVMKDLIDKAEVLIEALPYMRRFYAKTIVIKYGGSAMSDDDSGGDRRFPVSDGIVAHVGPPTDSQSSRTVRCPAVSSKHR